MIFENLLNKFRERPKPNEIPKHWVKCKRCQSIMFYKEVALKNYVCQKCNYHLPMGLQQRIDLLCDEGSFQEQDIDLKPSDPLKFTDKKSYKARIKDSFEKTNRYSAAVAAKATIHDIAVELVIFDFEFMGGSLGSVEGEKITRAIKRAIDNKTGFIIISASGGARMQEGIYALMQMAKTSAALKLLDKEKLPFISVLTNPTFGGVSASFAMLGDIIIAEPGAQIGFAGQRVIKQTIGEDLPEGFQSSEFLLDHGLIDMIVQRDQLKSTIADFLKILS